MSNMIMHPWNVIIIHLKVIFIILIDFNPLNQWMKQLLDMLITIII